MKPLVASALALALAALAGCGSGLPTHGAGGGNPAAGHRQIVFFGCGACHQIGGVADANGHVGPPLVGLRGRATIAGTLANTPPNVVRWIMGPQAVVPGNDMPDLGVSRAQARDIVAYLYTQ